MANTYRERYGIGWSNRFLSKVVYDTDTDTRPNVIYRMNAEYEVIYVRHTDKREVQCMYKKTYGESTKHIHSGFYHDDTYYMTLVLDYCNLEVYSNGNYKHTKLINKNSILRKPIAWYFEMRNKLEDYLNYYLP